MNPDSSHEPSLRERFRQEVSGAILRAAESVFADHGLHASSMNEIAARAGVAVGTLYNHFKDKGALLAGLLAQRREELLAHLDHSAKTAKEAPFRAQLEAMVRALFEHFEAHRAFFLILCQDEQAGVRGNLITTPSPQRPTPTMEEIYHRFDKLVRRGVQKKALKPSSALLLPALLMGMMRSLITRELYLAERSNLIEHVPQLVDFVLHGAGTAR